MGESWPSQRHSNAVLGGWGGAGAGEMPPELVNQNSANKPNPFRALEKNIVSGIILFILSDST